MQAEPRRQQRISRCRRCPPTEVNSQEYYIQAVKTFNAFLESKHLRKTPERFAILRQVWTMDAHFGIDQLHSALEQSGYHVSRATAYNTVDLLVECGVLRRHTFGSAEAQYEAAREGHLHLICTRCGAIQEAPAPVGLEHLENSLGGFRPAYMLAYVYGLCADCARKSEIKPGTPGSANT